MLITRSKPSNSKKNIIQEKENCPKDEVDIINLKKVNINIINTTNINTNKEIIASKGGENDHNIDSGITLNKSDNNIPNSRTERNNITSLSDENNHPKLSTLSENELIKNIIIDTATKIKKNSHNYLNMNANNNDASLGNKSNSIFSPVNTLKTENDKNNLSNNTMNYIKNNEKLINLENGMSISKSNENNNNTLTENENKKGINNDMNPLDMMNQVITTNSNLSNDTQEQLLNTNLNNTNNSNSTNNINNTINLNNTNKFNITNFNNRGDSDLLEYSKSCATNQTNFNINSEENTLTNHNNSNNIYNNSTKKNELQKKISYHCGKYMHKKRINLNYNFNNLNENEVGNINEDELDENDDKENEDKMNSIKCKNLNINHRNILSTIDNSKYYSMFDTNNPQNKNKRNHDSINSNKNNELDISNTPNDKITKVNNTNSNSAIPLPYYNSCYNNNFNMINTNSNSNSNSNSKYNSHYIENTNRTNNNGNLIANSLLNTTINDTSSMKKYAKKLTILSELENSKYSNQYNLNNIFNLKTNSIQPIKTGSNVEMLTNENESDIQIGSPASISNTLSSKLHDWLISCDLLCYYNLLIKNKLYNIEEYIDKIKQNKLSVTYKNIEDLGIRKPGHIFRFLLKLKLDSGLIDPYLYSIISDKYNRNSLNDMRMSISNNGFGCCCFRNNNCKIDKRSINSCYGNDNYGEGSNDIFCFLRKLELFNLKENFIHNGFDQVEYIILQMFSEFKFNKEVLNEYLHIYNDEDKKKVLKKLYLEKKNICQEYNIEYDSDEEKEILTPRNEDKLDNSKPNDSCLIF